MAMVVWHEVLPALMALSRRPNNQRKVQLRIVQHLAFLTDMGMFRGDPYFIAPEDDSSPAEATPSTSDQCATKSKATVAVQKEKMDVEEPVKDMEVETPEDGDDLAMVVSGVAWALQPLFDDDDVGAAVLAAHGGDLAKRAASPITIEGTRAGASHPQGRARRSHSGAWHVPVSAPVR